LCRAIALYKASGGLGNYGWGVDLKKKILKEEGVG